MNAILQVKDVTKYYGAGSIVTKALDGISFSVQKGEFVAVMGASGSGKSTLLNVVSTIDRVSSGDVIVEGTSVVDMKEDALSAFRRDKLGFIFQDYNLLDTLTIAENITLPLNLRKASAAFTENELNRVGGALGVEDQFSKFPRELSGGQKQRAACARAIITNPALILADEPTGALDSKNSRLLMQTFSHMNDRMGCTVLMVTHDAVVGSYAGRVLFLKDGRIFSEIRKGTRDRREFYEDILSVLSSLGGDINVR